MSEKVFMDTRLQVRLLKSRGVIIKNNKWAKQTIRNVNYYNLINGYKEPFLQNGISSDKYLIGTTLEEIYALYEFDRKLRIVTLEYILEVEKQVKSLISYSFSKSYGHKDYLRLENFDTKGIKKFSQTCDLLSNLYRKIHSNIDKDLPISHYVDNKNYIPLWVLVNSISLGDTSKFYSNMLQKERQDVARRFKWGLREHQLSSSLFFLSTIRNRCAHDERLYSYSSYINLCQNNYFKYFNVNEKNTNNYFAVMVAFKILLNDKRFSEYITQIEALLNELSSQLSTISLKTIRNIMGVPSNWKKLKTLQ